MRAWVDAVSLVGSALRVTAPGRLPADRHTLAVATAIRVFERFQALAALTLAGGDGEVTLTRGEVERLLAPEGFAALCERSRWHPVLARAVQRYAEAHPEAGT